ARPRRIARLAPAAAVAMVVGAFLLGDLAVRRTATATSDGGLQVLSSIEVADSAGEIGANDGSETEQSELPDHEDPGDETTATPTTSTTLAPEPTLPPRIVVVGDSTAGANGRGLQAWAGTTGRLEVSVVQTDGCAVFSGA